MTAPAVTESVRSVCPYCGVGCGIVMEVSDGRVTRVTGDRRHPANFGRLCTKGVTCAVPLTDPGRLDRARIRRGRGGEAEPVAMEAALRETGRRLRALVDAHGPDAVSLYVSGQMSLEAQYLANKLAKGFIRTRHIESNSRLCMASAGSGYKLSLGSDAPPGSYQDLDRADLFLVVGANMADCHPILFLRMMDRVKAGAKLIVIDPRRNATAEKADLFLQIRPGTDLALLNGLLHLLARAGRIDEAFIARHTRGWEAMPSFLEDYPPEKVASICGLNEADIRQAADWIGQAPEWTSCWTMGLNQSTHGTWNTNALCNLHLATGAICRPGSGPFSLTGQPNAMGGREMGYMGPGLPGQRSALVESDRAFVEDLWAIPRGSLRAESGRGTIAMFEEMATGAIKACWIVCTNPVASVANRATVVEGLRAAEFVVAQDAFLDTETNRFADALLPGALWAEADGVMVNSERNLTLTRRAAPPPREAMADWEIIARVAREMGYGEAFAYTSAAEVFEEIKRAWNPATGYDLRGASHERLRQGPVQWPCPPGDESDRHPIRYLAEAIPGEPQDGNRPALAFATPDGRAVFHPRPHMDPAEMPDDDHPFALNTGRLQHQWHTLTKTGKVEKLNRLNPGPFVEIHPDDAGRLGVRDGDRVEIRSRRGRAVLPASVTDRVRPGDCFAPFHWNDLFGGDLAVNAVTSDAVDPVSQQPELKFCAVSLSRVGAGTPPLDPGQGAEVRTESGTDPVLILWASQTGGAEAFAARCAARLEAEGVPVVRSGLDRTRPDHLAAASRVLLVASTFGDGEPPDNGRAFWDSLRSGSAPDLSGLSFSVAAFGDSSFERFCGFGRDLDARLEALGARRLHPRTDCDGEPGTAATKWLDGVATVLSGRNPTPSVPASETPVPAAPGSGRDNPLPTRLAINRRIDAAGSEREIRQIGFALGGTGFAYEAGDALGVWPTNDPALVAATLEAIALPGGTPVELEGTGSVPLAEALGRHLEISRLSPETLRFVRERTGNGSLPPEGEALDRWSRERRLVDLLREFPVRAEAGEWVAVLRRLQPRLYSISSSPKAFPDEVHLTVSIVRPDGAGRGRDGVCSTFLADRAEGREVPIFLRRSPHFHLPADPSVPVIMIGPGTGIAPFRGFLQERRAVGATGRNWLLFGGRHEAGDFLYRDELEDFRRDGFLHRLDTAFSRDQPEKIYVQHRLAEQAAALWSWLQDGAHLYVCGDASRMAKDVDTALRAAVASAGGMAPDRADAYVAGLAAERRYLRDVY